MPALHGPDRLAAWSGYALGFALGGFFDGILLHQILQWHHLLSGVEQARQDIRLLILADGLFHLLMYAVAALGLYWLWRSRQVIAQKDNRFILGRALLGFGAWHLLDAVLSHWVLGIHRIRMDTDNPLLWDLLWLAAFGLLPLVAGLLWHRTSHRSRSTPLMVSPIALGLAVLVSGAVATRPPPGDGPTLVLFHPGVTAQSAFSAMHSLGARVVWTDPTQQLWALDLPEGFSSTELYRHGAILVSQSILPSGCLEWSRPQPVEPVA
jgi:uncharacterized membrane protein